jgi:Leucine-rich repeat (LRR) protein
MLSSPDPEQLVALVGWYQGFSKAQGELSANGLDVADWLWLTAKLHDVPLPSSTIKSDGAAFGRTSTASTDSSPSNPDQSSDSHESASQTQEKESTKSKNDNKRAKKSSVIDNNEPNPVSETKAETLARLSAAALPNQLDVDESLQSYSDWLVAFGGQPLRLRIPPVFPSALALLKPLKPLLHQRVSHHHQHLDEELSAERSADMGIVWPMFRPGREPGLQVRLVLDGGVSMAVWKPLAEELQQVLASSQALAQVKIEFLQLANLAAAIERERRLQPIADGQVITLLISDTAGLHWWDRSIQPWLEAVGHRQPMAVVHILPYRYRKATALCLGMAVSLYNQRMLAANAAYEAVEVRWRDPWAEEKGVPPPKEPPKGVVVPVISLDRREAGPWAAMMMGDHQARCPGVVLVEVASHGADPGKLPLAPLPQELLKGFQQLASPEAMKLMQWMAASPAPLTLGVLRLLQGALRQQDNSAQPLAEVLVSGLLVRLPGQYEVALEKMQFQIIPELRAVLRKNLDPAARQTVLHLVTDVLERHWNRKGIGPSFEALVTDPSVQHPPEAEGLLHVANLTADMLDELPGMHLREIAERLRTSQQGQVVNSRRSSDDRLQLLSEADLDRLIDDLLRDGTTELILLGPEFQIPTSADEWPESLRHSPVIYQLNDAVPELARRLARLTQLTSLDLRCNKIGAAGTAFLKALTQLTTLNLFGNMIGDEGAEILASLTQLTFLDLSWNQIGSKGAASLAALSKLTSLRLRANQIDHAGATALATCTKLVSLDLGFNKIDDKGVFSLVKLNQLRTLDLDGNEITSNGAASLATLTKLSSLNLEHNEIGAAGAAFLAALDQLNYLNLGHNRIGNQGMEALSSLTQLKFMNMSSNGITDAGLIKVRQMSHLIVFDLSFNLIGASGAAALSCLTQLSELNLSYNGIDDAGAISLAGLANLTSLNLRSNKIDDSGVIALRALDKLSFLDLSQNFFGEIGVEALGALMQLKCLRLVDNRIGDSGVVALSCLVNLTSLNLNMNNITEVGVASLASLRQLKSLDLGDNDIGDKGAAALFPLYQLTSLNLEGNQISAEGVAALALGSHKYLTSLNLSGNSVGDAGAEILSVFTNLKSLNLSYNRIGDAGAVCLAVLANLTTLNLEENHISDIGATAFAALENLTTLDLERNDISDVSPFASLDRLIFLNLKDTKVSSLLPIKSLLESGLDVVIEKLCAEDINVYGCPLVHPPPEIVLQGRQAVLNYLREIEVQGEDHLYEAKVLILGDGGAGKTSLLRRLYQTDLPLPAEEESTKGIDIHRHTFTNAAERPFHLNVWDFGGQQIYHATHRFFLTKRSLYILVDDTRNNSQAVQDVGFKYWLELIEAFSEGSPVLIFQNEKAGSSKIIDTAGIKGRFPNVKDVYCGDLDHADAAEKLAEAIRFHVQQLPHVGEAVPARWLAIRAELDERKQQVPYISQEDYFQIYGRYLEFDEAKALQLSRYLHDLGVFLHFQDDPLLARLVILKNDWATEAVFNVLNDEPTKARSGYFTRADCQRIWAHSTYRGLHPELLALMEKFELCHKFADQPIETWLAPQLLSPYTPEAVQDWPQPDDLVLTYQYDFLPKGLICSLICRMNRFVRHPDRSWRSGAFFEHGQSELLARIASPVGPEIELRARGGERKDLLNVISSDLDALNDSFVGLRDKVRKLVPCLCNTCRLSTNPERYEEGRLQKRKQDGRLTVECPESYEDVRVLELLDGLKFDALPAWANPDRMVRPRTIKILLASTSDLKEDREAFDLYFRQANDRLLKQGIYLEILRWETFLDAMSETRLQDEYNEAVRNSDIFVSLFKTKTGKYTAEEFDIAHTAFRDSGKPRIYTYFMQANIPMDKRLQKDLNSRWEFEEKLTKLGHYPTYYTSIEDLKLQFQQQLDKLIEAGQI